MPRKSTGYVAAKIRAHTAQKNSGYARMSEDDLIDIYAGKKKGDAQRALAELKKIGWTERELDEMIAKADWEEYERTEDWYYTHGRHLG
jgi:hypothetical protein